MAIISQADQLNASVREHHQLAGLEIKPRPSLSKWLTVLLAAYLVVVALEFFAFNQRWNWGLILDYLFSQRIMQGLMNTILLTVVSTAIGLVLGIIAAWGKLSNFVVFRTLASLYVWIIRATPLLVILLMVFFLAALTPTLGIGIPFGPSFFDVPTNDVISRFSAAIIGLSLYLGGKSAEVFRSGIISVDRGQFEACRSVGLSPWTTYSRVIGPQTIRVITPPMANEVITMFKNTSLVSVIGFTELLTTTQLIYANNFQTIPLLTVAVIWYLVLTSIAMYGQSKLEQRFGRGFVRKPNTKKPPAGLKKVDLAASPTDENGR
jgi:polar amino acid transport system permease protein